ncbi:MAG: hypothetical protein NTZ79_11185 [Proteobacteria bacterium]|nr:hypothetical protein [Pseudomonadota bacterium]
MADSEPAPVWPYKNGHVRGIAFYPLYPAVPAAAARNLALGELLVLFDALGRQCVGACPAAGGSGRAITHGSSTLRRPRGMSAQAGTIRG